MSRISFAKVCKMRSGRTVYRIWGYAGYKGRGEKRWLDLKLDIETYHFCGKRHMVDGKEMMFSNTDKMVPHFKRKHNGESGVRPYTGRNWFDSWGDNRQPGGGVAWFTTKRSAERFVEEVKAGLHPWVVWQLVDHHEMCDQLDEGLGVGNLEPDDFPFDDGDDYYPMDELEIA